MATNAVIPTGLVAGQRGISAAWMQGVLDAIRRYHPVAGRGVAITQTPNGAIISCRASASSVAASEVLRPFTVRWYSWEKSDAVSEKSGEWQIYLPLGCLTLNGVAAIPSNDRAMDGEGGKTISNWYRIEDPADADGDASVVGGRMCKSWVVSIAVKPWPQFTATTTKQTAYDADADLWFKRIAVASIGSYNKTTTTDDGQTKVVKIPNVAQLVSTAQSLTRDTESAFAIDYRTDDDIYAESAVWKPYLVNQKVNFGRFTSRIETPTSLPNNAEHAVLKITHETEDFEIEVVNEEGTNTDDVTYVTLYDLKDGIATADYRAALDDLPFYTN